MLRTCDGTARLLHNAADGVSDRVRDGQGLTMGHYWYHVEDDGEEDMYASLSSFRAWRYTPEKMPNNWRNAVPWRGVEDDDQEEGNCCVTGEDGAVLKAHLVDETE